MRILGRLAAAAGVTAVVLLASPTANAADAPWEQAAQSVGSSDQKAIPGLGGGVPIVDQVLKGLLGGLTGGGLG